MLDYQTVDQLREMRLGAMKKEFLRQTELPAMLGLSFEERFAMIVQAEWNHRQDNKQARLVKCANLLCSSASLEDIDFDTDRGLSRSSIASLSSCNWIRNGQFLFLTGASGVGKSWIASAFAAEACRRRYAVKCFRVPRLMDELKFARLDNTWNKCVDAIKKMDLVVLDDFALDRFDAQQARDFLELVDDRIRYHRSLIITAQRPVSQWHELFEDPTVADAIMDRLANNSYRIELSGQSMRTKQRPFLEGEV